MPLRAYEESLSLVRKCQAELPTVFAEVDVLVTPSAPGEAPELGTTGDPIFNRAWSALGTPVVSVPAGTGPSGLPLGVQIVGMPQQDARSLACAAWVEAALSGRQSRAL
jgi:Asp-tRNA(Asn)/Glu-tRNA(Gln) amidotransferase A subunit family amidase